MKRPYSRIALIAACATLGACAAHYTTPVGGTNFAELANDDVRGYYQNRPAGQFPANIAIVRVQDNGPGGARYNTITARDVETDDHFEGISGLPLIRGVAPLGRMLVPANVDSIRELRAPAAMLHADLLLIYSIDTVFTIEGKSLGPLSMISLGLIPNRKAHVAATVAGVLVDVRTGFVYGTGESTAKEEQLATIWSTRGAIESSRLRAEAAAFGEFVDEFARLWESVVDVHAATQLPATPAGTPMPVVEQGDAHYRIRFSN